MRPLVVVLFVFATFQNVSYGDIVIADSVAEFSGTQGQDNWHYGYYATPNDPSSFIEMTLFDATGSVAHGAHWEESVSQPPWALLWANGGHPGGFPEGDEHWAVRRYVSEVAGNVTISGSLADLESGGVDGVVGRIFVNNSEVHSQAVAPNATGLTYSFLTNLTVGDFVDFAIDPVAHIQTDTTQFTGVVSVPEPSAFVFMGLVGLAAFGFNRIQAYKLSFATFSGKFEPLNGQFSEV